MISLPSIPSGTHKRAAALRSGLRSELRGFTWLRRATAAHARISRFLYQNVAVKTATSYSIDHTAGTYVIDREGRVRLFVKHGEGVEPIVADLKRLLS